MRNPKVWIVAVFALFAGSAILCAQERKKDGQAPKADQQAPKAKPPRAIKPQGPAAKTPPPAAPRAQAPAPRRGTPTAPPPPAQVRTRPPQPQVKSAPQAPARVRTLPQQPPAGAKTPVPPPIRAQSAPARPSPSPGVRYPAAQGKTFQARSGGTVHKDVAGNVREVHTPSGAIITHRPEGIRRVEARRPGGRVVVADAGGRHGYVQRPLDFRDQHFVQRTYFSHGRSYAQIYRPRRYGAFVYDIYVPYRYYRPAFYAWIYRPWRAGFYFHWGWIGSPWYAYYGSYFTPSVVYPSPAFWLTDYVMAATLEEAYQARLDAVVALQTYPPSGREPLRPEVKQAIAEEVRRELDLERAEAEGATAYYGAEPPIFAANGPRVFIVSSPLRVYTAGGGECAITEGDVLRITRRPQPDASYAELEVLASKGPDCPCGVVVSVPLQDLQEMNNQMRARIDRGLAELQSRQGQGGLPALPSGIAGPPVNAPFAGAVRPDTNVAAELSNVIQEALEAEQGIIGEAVQPAPSPGPAVVRLGQSIDEVVAILGTPEKVVDLGPKQIYVYRDMKVTFLDGRVSDVE